MRVNIEKPPYPSSERNTRLSSRRGGVSVWLPGSGHSGAEDFGPECAEGRGEGEVAEDDGDCHFADKEHERQGEDELDQMLAVALATE